MGLPPRDSATRSLVSRDGGPESKVVLELFQAFDHMERTPRAPVAARRPPTRPGERHEAHRELYVEEARRAILLASQYADLNAATAAQLEAARGERDAAVDATAALRACTDALLVEARRGAAPPAAPADGDAPRAPPPPCETPAPRRRRPGAAPPARAPSPASPPPPPPVDAAALDAAVNAVLRQRDALHLLRLHYLADDGRPRYEQLCGDLGIVPHLADFRTAQRIAAEVRSPTLPVAEFLARVALSARLSARAAAPDARVRELLQVLDLGKKRIVLAGGRTIRFRVWGDDDGAPAGPRRPATERKPRRAPDTLPPPPFSAPAAARGQGETFLTRGL